MRSNYGTKIRERKYPSLSKEIEALKLEKKEYEQEKNEYKDEINKLVDQLTNMKKLPYEEVAPKKISSLKNEIMRLKKFIKDSDKKIKYLTDRLDEIEKFLEKDLNSYNNAIKAGGEIIELLRLKWPSELTDQDLIKLLFFCVLNIRFYGEDLSSQVFGAIHEGPGYPDDPDKIDLLSKMFGTKRDFTNYLYDYPHQKDLNADEIIKKLESNGNSLVTDLIKK